MKANGVDKPTNASNLERSIERLTDERGALFDRAGAAFGLSAPDQQRLSTIERELDECFLARRRLRAERDARRFDAGMGFRRQAGLERKS
jgi:hypothetical protein